MGAHDLQYRKTFSDSEMFKIACQIYLPPEVRDKLNFEKLKLRQMSGAFIRNLIILEYNVRVINLSEVYVIKLYEVCISWFTLFSAALYSRCREAF